MVIVDDTQKKREQRRTRSRGNRWSAEGTDLPKSEVWALAGNSGAGAGSRFPWYLLWMLEGHEAPLVLSHHAPGHHQAVSASRQEMPLVEAQTLHSSLMAVECLQEKMPLFSVRLQLRL